jgi:hypothetical protein
MKRIQIFAVILFLLVSVVYMPTVMAIGLGGGGTGHMDNPSPWCGEVDVPITDKGVQTCINVTVDQDCTVNLTFQWFNVTQYAIDWLDWWMDWPYGGSTPSFYDDVYWLTYGESNDVNASGQHCFYNENVTCSTDGSWTEWQDWRVIANFTCSQNYTYNETFYCHYMPELCPLFYIYPPWNATDVCPCCDAMCVGINNVNGHGMNITIYRNDSHFEEFYMINEYNNVTNNTYCFCIDGHINNSMYYPMRYNETYFWYINVTDTVTGEYMVSDTYQFTTARNLSECPCGEEAIRLATGRGEIIRFGSLHDLSAIAFIFAIIALLAIIIIYHNRGENESEEEEKVKDVEDQDETGR